ncbi:STAS domain-containing protein [Dactylosporangium sp. AC04546]|uniref:STAS domain-containing protein n=1 Tax=Dactylosporangium sp. AC04546 TaxID=2862460 RepID=UPI001EDFD2F9|nr:STAS domain-containing protein [Dactylosporangium sp. AC04546]WVK85743.1 STAS domain-containing protein [Dactylosporangium sp. AC04546]
MSVTVNVTMDGSTIVTVRGEIDHTNATTLRQEIVSAATSRRPSVLRVDLGLVTFLDSAAVGALVAAQREAGAEGVRVIVHRASPFVHRQLRVAGVHEMLGAPAEPDPDHIPF